MFRMAHVFLSLGQLDQAQQVTTATSHALEPVISASNPPVEALSLYGALHLVLAIAAGRDNDRSPSDSASCPSRGPSASKIDGRS
jgi:hypothetical protein